MARVIQDLCWLPMCLWVEFKVLVMTYKTLHGLELAYLRDWTPCYTATAVVNRSTQTGSSSL